VTGRFLAHNKHDQINRAFMAADLHAGKTQLILPTIVQSAILARVNQTYAHWAFKRLGERADIEAGFIPLVPPKASASESKIWTIDEYLADVVRSFGIDRVLDAAAKVEDSVLDFNDAPSQFENNN
jgi:hypothetical protein